MRLSYRTLGRAGAGKSFFFWPKIKVKKFFWEIRPEFMGWSGLSFSALRLVLGLGKPILYFPQDSEAKKSGLPRKGRAKALS
jgi:hypothetical protein